MFHGVAQEISGKVSSPRGVSEMVLTTSWFRKTSSISVVGAADEGARGPVMSRTLPRYDKRPTSRQHEAMRRSLLDSRFAASIEAATPSCTVSRESAPLFCTFERINGV
jgi:hypothetical protein